MDIICIGFNRYRERNEREREKERIMINMDDSMKGQDQE